MNWSEPMTNQQTDKLFLTLGVSVKTVLIASLLCLWLLPAAVAAPADLPDAPPLRFHRLFTDHMVLQRDAVVPVYGIGKPGATVAVRIGKVTWETTVAPDGRWQVDLPPFPAGGPHRIEARQGQSLVAVDDVLFGDIWLASGQSNMEYRFGRGVLDTEQEAAAADFPEIRFFNVPSRQSDVPETDLNEGRWQMVTPQTMSATSRRIFLQGIAATTTLAILGQVRLAFLKATFFALRRRSLLSQRMAHFAKLAGPLAGHPQENL